MHRNLEEMRTAGQSVWLDHLRRALLVSGYFERWIDAGVRGVTIDYSALAGVIRASTDYDDELHSLGTDPPPAEIIERILLADARQAADLLAETYQESGGADGFVSLDLPHAPADDAQEIVAEAERLVDRVDRPNLMIKVPATAAGLSAIPQLVGAGVNVQATLIFTRSRATEAARAYLNGLEERMETGGQMGEISSVVSFGLGPLDARVDAQLRARGADELRGKVASAAAWLAHRRFEELFSGERWERLAAAGAGRQRLAWTRTIVTDPLEAETAYVECLRAQDTVIVLAPDSLRAVLAGTGLESRAEEGGGAAEAILAALDELGLELEDLAEELEQEALEARAQAYEDLVAAVGDKLADLRRERRPMDLRAGGLADQVARAVRQLEQVDLMERIWRRDHTVWAEDPAEISNRLGWLTIPARMRGQVRRLKSFTRDLREEGIRQVVLLGMGGSSLAPEVFRDVLGLAEGGLELQVLDSTDPQAITQIRAQLDLSETIFIVATKSGSTVETLSLFKHFYNQVEGAVGTERAGAHFVGITDPGSNLVRLAEEHGFRELFRNDPDIGGRYSALSYFGMVPAALIGADIELLLERAVEAATACEAWVAAEDNPALQAGAYMSEAASSGRDKLTFLISPDVVAFGDWVEQLIAESTGKSGKGILPVVREPLGDPVSYGSDRAFVHLRTDDDDSLDELTSRLQQAGHPLLRLRLRDRYDLAAQMFLWEMATAIAGHGLGVHPFNQPNVEAAKVRAREMVAAYRQEGELPDERPLVETDNLRVYWGSPGGEPEAASAVDLASFWLSLLASVRPGSYLGIQAYLTPSEAMDRRLRQLQARLRELTGLVVTVGYGPRFLHSTGQLHKGDGGRGLFLQLTDEPAPDVPIPVQAGEQEAEISFGTLKLAQAMGDRQALAEAGRTVVRIDLGKNPQLALDELLEMLADIEAD